MSGYNATVVPDRVASNGPSSKQGASGKRPRRMRSLQGAAHYGNGQKGKKGPGVGGKVEYHDRRSAAPIFLQKTFEMINSCDPNLASWTEDGTMFVIKDQKVFAEHIIPKFFDHNKFSSFARQLNFYGFRKMQSRAIYKDDFNKETAKHVTFFNEKFQRGKPELLKEIQRSTKGGQNAASNQEQQKEINILKDRVSYLENNISLMQNDYNERLAALETQLYHYVSYSNGQPPMSSYAQTGNEERSNGIYGGQMNTQNPLPPNLEEPIKTENGPPKATLAPHPNSKVLPDNRVLPPPPTMRHESFLRGLSTASIGLADMSTFEQKYLESTLSGPDPSETTASSNPAALTRQMSEGLGRLDLNDFPPLGV